MKPFDLEAAKNGAPVCTRNGKPARIICWDAKGTDPIVALIYDGGSEERVIRCHLNGLFLSNGNNHNNDLMMVGCKREGWVNIYRRLDGSIKIGGYNATKAEATIERTLSLIDYSYIATVKIEWEE